MTTLEGSGVAMKVDDLFKNIDVSDAMRQWTRFSSDAWSSSMRLGQPMFEAYLKSLSGAAAELDKAYRKSCEIPETECPPYCVCELEWEAFRGDSIKGTIAISNTGKQVSVFALSASEFRAEQELTSVKAQLSPSSFNLKSGETQRVDVAVHVDESMNPNQTYRAEVKVAGRYEQCVQLVVHVRRKQHPYCIIEHGEIPTRIRAHHWYDHFQCDELCFEPVRHRDQREPVKPAANVAAAKQVTAKHKSTRAES
jgi:hypothetical protein